MNLVKTKPRAPGTTESVDDYLKAIFELSGPEEQRVTSNALAGHLDVRAASVTGMLQKLAGRRPSFIEYEKHHGVVLTEMGKPKAKEKEKALVWTGYLPRSTYPHCILQFRSREPNNDRAVLPNQEVRAALRRSPERRDR